MAQVDLYTVKVFQVPNGKVESDHDPTSDMSLIDEHPNMISARILKGRIVELEHSKLAGPDVKFKTVLDYDRILDSGDTLGIAFVPQNGYIAQPGANC